MLFALAFYPAVAESQATVTNARAYFFIEGADLDTVNARLSFPELTLPATTIETTPASMFAETVVTTSYQVVLAVRDFTPYGSSNEDLTKISRPAEPPVSPNTEIQYYVYRSGLTYTVPDGQRSYISGNPSGSGGEYRMSYYIQATTETCTQLRGQTATCRATAPPTTEEVPNTALNFTLTVLNSLTLNASYSSDGHTTAYPLVTDQPLQKGDNQYLKITRATLDSGTMRNTLIAHRISSSCRVSSAANAASCADSRIEKKTGHVKTFGKEHSIPTGTSLVPTPGQGSTTLELSGSLTYPGFYPITYEPHYTTLYQGEVPATVIGNSAPYIRLNVAQNSVPGLVSALPANFSQYRLDTTFEFPAVTGGNGALTETLSGTLTLSGGGTKTVFTDNTRKLRYTEGNQTIDTGLTLTGGATAGGIPQLRGAANTLSGSYALTYTIADSDTFTGAADEYSGDFVLTVHDYSFATGNATDPALDTIVLVQDVALQNNLTLSRITAPANAQPNETLTFNSFQDPDGTTQTPSIAMDGTLMVGSTSTGLVYVSATAGTAGHIEGTPRVAGTYSLTQRLAPVAQLFEDYDISLQVVADLSAQLTAGTLDGAELLYLTSDSIGTPSDPLVLPAIASSGNTPLSAETLTSCYATSSATLSNCDAASANIETSGTNSLPKNLAFVAATGSTAAGLNGTVATAGYYRLTYSISDTPIANSAAHQAQDQADSDSITFHLDVQTDAAPTLGAIDDLLHLTGTELDETLPLATGGNGDLSYSLSGLTGSGLNFAPLTRKLTGTPTTAGDYTLMYSAIDSDSNTAANDIASVTFALSVQVNTPPTLSTLPRTSFTDHTHRPITDIALPAADDGNGPLKDSLSGTFDGDDDDQDGATTLDDDNQIILVDSAESGLTFTPRDAATVASITGTPAQAGTFTLTYSVGDSDSDETGNDVASVEITLTVALTTLTLSGGIADGAAVDLINGNQLTANITLPQVTGGASADANLSYSLWVQQTVDSNGDDIDPPQSPTTVTTAAIPGLTYTAVSGNTAGFLAGTPSANGTWLLAYRITDNNGSADIGDDISDTVNFTLSVLTADSLSIAASVPADFQAPSATVIVGDPVGADASTPLPLPAISGGYGTLTQSLTTTCTQPGSSTACAAGATSGTAGQAGSLPAGLTFTAADSDAGTAASLLGTFTSAGSYSLTYSVTDTAIGNPYQTAASADSADTVSVQFSLQVQADTAPTLNAIDDLLHLTGTELDETLPLATGGNDDLTYSLSGLTGSGLNFAPLTRKLTGTPTTAGDYSLVYSATDSDSNTAARDIASVTFALSVQVNAPPTLSTLPRTSFTDHTYRPITDIALPTIGGGNGPLKDSLSGTFDGADDNQDGAITLDDDNQIILFDSAESGLTFAPRDGDTVASITGTPAQTGTYTFTYSLRDDDSDETSGDIASTTLTLAITPAVLQLGGGIAHEATVNLAQGSQLTTNITLPQVSSGASGTANLSRTLTTQQTADSDGTIDSPQAPSAFAIPGLTYTAVSGNTAGFLAGTPSAIGTWLLAYRIDDNNGTTGAGNSFDDLSATISFTLNVLDNSGPSLSTPDSYSLSYTVADPVGADADTPFPLPAISGGNGAISDSVATTCAPTSGSGTCAAAALSGTAGEAGSLPAGLIFTAADTATDTAATLSGAFTSYGVTYSLTYSVSDSPLTLTHQATDTANTTTAVFTFVVAQGNSTPTFTSQTPSAPTLLEKRAGDNADNTANTNDDPRLITTLTFADTDTLSYSITAVTPSPLTVGDFSVAAATGNQLQAELHFVGSATAVDYDNTKTFTVTVRADDGGVNGQLDQPVVVTVLENAAPSVSVGVSGTPSLLPGSDLTLIATATDTSIAAGDALTYVWTVTAATAAAATGATAAVGDISLTPSDDQTGASLTVPAKPSGTSYDIQVAVTDLAPQTTTAIYSLVVANADIAFSYSPSPSAGTPPAYRVANGIVATSGDDSDLIATITASDPNAGSLEYSGTVSVAGADTILGLSSRNSTDISGIFGFATSGADLGELSVISATPLTAGATYELRLTVAKTKGDGSKQTATADFNVVVPAPNAANKTSDIAAVASLPRGTTSTINLYDHFSPAAGLTFTAESSNTKVLTVGESGGVLTLTATAAGGVSSVEVTASNASTMSPPSTTFSVTVTPTNDPRLPAAQVTNIEASSKDMTVGDSLVLDLDTHFMDADSGDTLSYELLDASDAVQTSITYRQTPGGTALLTASLSDAALTLVAQGKTSADLSIKIRATDNGGNTGTGTFVATVTNTVPAVSGTIDPQIAVIDETTALSLTLGDYFADAETLDADLVFSASSGTAAAVSAATVDPTSKVLSLTVPDTASHGDTSTITVTAQDASLKTITQTFVATAVSRPAFSAATDTATLAENANGSGTAVLVKELTLSGGAGAKTYTVVSVDGQTSGTDYSKFAVAAKLDASNDPIDTMAVVTYRGTGEDYEALKAVSTPAEPTFTLVIGVTDANMLAADDDLTLTVTVTDVNEAPTASAACSPCTGSYNAAPGVDVQLLATASDPDAGDSLTYSWTLSAATAATPDTAAVTDIDLDTTTAGVQASIAAQNPTIALPRKRAGTSYNFSLQVSDNDASPLTASTTLELTLTEAEARFVQVASDSTRTVLGSNLTLSAPFQSGTGHLLATIQAEDPNGGALTYTLGGTDADDFAFESDPDSATYGQLTVMSTNGLTDGDYSLTLTATKTQADGGTDSTALSITTTINRAGGVALTSPIGNQSITRTNGSASPLILTDLGQHFTPSIELTFSEPTSDNPEVATVFLVPSSSGEDEDGYDLRITPTGAGGTATITYGASNAAQMTPQTGSFTLSVTPSRAPVFTTNDIASRLAMDLSGAVVLALDDYFSDPDSADHGDTLTYRLLDADGNSQSSIIHRQTIGGTTTDVLTVALSDSSLTLTPMAPTTSAIPLTLSATDNGNNATTVTVNASVINAVPTAVGGIAAITLAHGGSHSLSNLAQYFGDDQGTAALTFSYTPDSGGVLTGALNSGGGLDLQAATDAAPGTLTATLTASDSANQSATQTITAHITNAAPTTQGSAPTVPALIAGDTHSLDLAQLFADSDSTLSYSASSSDTAVTLNTDSNGVPVDSGNDPTAQLTITAATAGGSATVTISANDRASRNGVSDPSWTLQVSVESGDRPIFSAALSDQQYTLGVATSLTLPLASGGNGALTYSLSPAAGSTTTISGGNLLIGGSDTGLDFTPVSGGTAASISGTATTAGTLNLRWTVVDGDSDTTACSNTSPLTPANCDSDFDDLQIVIHPAPTFGAASVAATTYVQGLAAGATGTAAALSLPRASTGTGAPPLAYSLSGSTLSGANLGSSQVGGNTQQHPPGMSLALTAPGDTQAATLSGTPTQAGTYSMVWSVRDGNGASASLSAAFQITVVADGQPSLPAALTSLTCTYQQDTDYSAGTGCPSSLSPSPYANALPRATGGNGTLTYSLTPLPAGMTFSTSARTLSGTPTTAAVYQAQYSVSDADGDSVSLPMTLIVDGEPTLTSPGDLVLNRGQPLTGAAAVTLPRASGGNGASTYSLASTDGKGIPAGLTFDAGSSTLSGTPTHSGDYGMIYSATDSDGDSDSVRFRITVDGTPEFAADVRTLYNLSGNSAQTLPAVIPGSGNGAITYSVAPATGSDLSPDDYRFVSATRALSLNRRLRTSNPLLSYIARDADGDSSPPLILELRDNTTPVADAGADQNALPGQLVTLDGSASHDPDDLPQNGVTPTPTALTYQWTQQSGAAVTLSDAGAPTPSFTAPQVAGDLVFALVVDDGVRPSNPDRVRVRVVAVHDEVLGRYILSQVDVTNSVLGERIEELAGNSQDQTNFTFSNNSAGSARLDRFVLPLSRVQVQAQASAPAAKAPRSNKRSSFDGDGSGSGSVGGRGVSVWGAVRHDTISESGGGVDSLSGQDSNLHLGVDVPLAGNILGGLLLTRSRGDIDFKIGSVNNGYRLNLSQFTPYLAFATSGFSFWGGAGNGQGRLFIESDSGAIQRHEATTSTSMANLKARIIGGATKLHLRLQSTSSELSLDFAQLGLSGRGDGEEDYNLQTDRMRVGLELSRSFTLANGDRLVPSLQLASIDETMTGSQGETTTGGSEIGLSFSYVLPVPQWTIAAGGRVRTLDDGREEEGAYLLLQLDPRSDNRGLEMNLKPVWGQADSTTDQLWEGNINSGSAFRSSSRGSRHGANISPAPAANHSALNSSTTHAANNSAFRSSSRGSNNHNSRGAGANNQRLDMSLSYGLELPGGRNLLHPFATLSLDPDGGRGLQAGLRWQPTPALQLNLSSTLRRDNQRQTQRDGTRLTAHLKF